MIGIGVQESLAEDFSFDWGKVYFSETQDITSPKKQLENGLEPREIICKNRLYLLYKTLDNSPICVKEYPSVVKLIERGYATLGETSIVITTDKEVYSLGENVTITMKNHGNTQVMFSGHAIFYLKDEQGTPIQLPLDTFLVPVERIAPFDTLASTTFVWNQTNRNLETANSDTYTVSTGFGEPLLWNSPSQLSYKQMNVEKTFEIIDETKSNLTTFKVDTGNQESIDVEYLLTGDAIITDIVYEQDINSLQIDLDTVTAGTLTIDVPRALIDAKHNTYCGSNHDNSFETIDDDFIILINGEEINYEETKTTQMRTLLISFEENSKNIEIVTTCLL